MTKYKQFGVLDSGSWGTDPNAPAPPIDIPWDEVCHPASVILIPQDEVQRCGLQRLRANCHASARHRGLNAKTRLLTDGSLRVEFRRESNVNEEAIKRFGPCPETPHKENQPARWIR